MAKNVDEIDWSKYPPDRVEGLKYFHKGPSSDEDGPPTEEELKMMCLEWKCNVDMRVDNVVFWLMKKTKEKNCNNNEETFQRLMPKVFAKIEKHGLDRYNRYQKDYAEKNKHYLLRCAEWRKHELRRVRYLEKLGEKCSKWTWDDGSDDDSDDETTAGSKIEKYCNSSFSNFTFASNSSVDTVIDTQTRYNDYLETESQHLQASINVDNVANEEEVSTVATLDEVNTQSFVPETTSTQS